MHVKNHPIPGKLIPIAIILCLLLNYISPQTVFATTYLDNFATVPFSGTVTSFTTGAPTFGLSYVGSNCDFSYLSGVIDTYAISYPGAASITITSRNGEAFTFSSIDIVDTVYDIQISGTGTAGQDFSFSVTASSSGTFSPTEGDRIVDQVVISNVGPTYEDFMVQFDNVNTDIAAPPEMNLQRPALTYIADGGQDNLGWQTLGAQSLTYTIGNTGESDLIISGVTASNFSNVNNYSLNTSTPITVSPSSTATFNITFNVVAEGSFSFDLSLANNDNDENPYNIQLVGIGDSTPPGITSFTRQIPAASPTNADSLVFRATFTEAVQNVGIADFSVNGATTATITGVSTVSSSEYDVTVSGGDLASFNGTVGIDLSGAQDITDLAGNVLPAGEPSTDETYTVDNIGPSVTINQASGQIDPTTNSPINFTVVFDQSVSDFATGDVTLSGTAGATTATVTGSGTTYNVAVSGMTAAGTVIASIGAGVASDSLGNLSTASSSTDNQVTYLGNPEIDIQRPGGFTIVDGGTDAVGNQPLGTVNLTYTVDNTLGIAALTISDVTATNLSNMSGFLLNTATPINIPSGSSGSFTISFNIPASGAFSFDMDITNNDPDEGNYDIAVSGTGYIEPEIEISYEGTTIPDNDITPSTAEGTDFGYDLSGYAAYSPQHTFTITNSGAGTLNLTGTPRVTVTGTDFSLISDAPASIAPGDSATFTVQFAASAVAVRNGSISIANNDSSENPYNFNITGTGYIGSLMIVQGGSPQQDIEDGDITPTIADDTEFGAVSVSGGTVIHTFEIENFGAGNLNLLGTPIVQITGTHAADFTVTLQPGSTIASGSNEIFIIEFNPSAAGNRTATVTIQNNDPNRNPYTFTIQGQGDNFTVMAGGNTNPTDGETLTAAPDSLLVQFTREALADGSADAANYINNYLLVEAGLNASFDTISCAGGLVSDDTQINISGVTYNSLANTATLTVNSADFTTNGQYRLFVCGTTSIYDTFGNELNGGVSDTVISFNIAAGGNANANTAFTLPATGFPIGENIVLPVQTVEKQYKQASMMLEIPTLRVELPIVGVPLIDGEWDVSWLDGEAGYLYGTAYPTWEGNTVITAHVWDAYNQPGPFANLKDLHFGDRISIQSGNKIYVYEVHDSRLHRANSIHSVITHEENDWLTLVTCEGYRESDQTYTYRRVIRAVLIEVLPK